MRLLALAMPQAVVVNAHVKACEQLKLAKQRTAHVTRCARAHHVKPAESPEVADVQRELADVARMEAALRRSCMEAALRRSC